MDCPPGQKKEAVIERWPLVEIRLYFRMDFSQNLFDIRFSYKGCNFTPVVKAECRVNIGKLLCMYNAKKKCRMTAQLNSSMHIAQVTIFSGNVQSWCSCPLLDAQKIKILAKLCRLLDCLRELSI